MDGRNDEADRRARSIQGILLIVLGIVALVAVVSDAQTSTKVLVGGFFLINVAVFLARAPR